MTSTLIAHATSDRSTSDRFTPDNALETEPPHPRPATAPVTLRAARVSDVPAVAELIAGWAAQGKMLPRTLPNLFESLPDLLIAERLTPGGPHLVGCAALHVLWHDVAELRCLAVAPGETGSGVGRQLVAACEARALELGIPQLFAWTLATRFFTACGFEMIDRETQLHPRVQAGCRHCPFATGCHEQAVLKQLQPLAAGAYTPTVKSLSPAQPA